MTEFREPSFVNGPNVLQSSLRGLLVAGAVGLLLGLMGPFGTYSRMETAERFGFWFGSIAVGVLIHLPLYWLGAWAGDRFRIPLWLWLPVSAVAAAAPMTLMVNGLAAAMFGSVPLDPFASLYPFVLAISLPMQVLTHVAVIRRPEASAAGADRPLAAPEGPAPSDDRVSAPLPPASAAAPAPTALPEPGPEAELLWTKLPVRLGRDVLVLQVQDHYLDVRTSAGSAVIYMRMSDAEHALARMDGLRVHRSWWVARKAVTGWRQDGKSLLLVIADGQEIPVARDRQAQVRQAGWLR